MKNLGDGYGVDVVIDAAGVSATFQLAMQVVRPAGQIIKVGWGPQPLGFNLDPMVQKAVTVQGSFSHNWPIWERVIHMIATGQDQPSTSSSAALLACPIGIAVLRRCSRVSTSKALFESHAVDPTA